MKTLLTFFSILFINYALGQTDSASLMARINKLDDFLAVDYARGLTLAHEVFSDAEKSQYLDCIARAYKIVGKYYWSDGNYPKGLSYLRPALAMAEHARDSVLSASILDLIGNTFYFQAYYDSAVYYFNQALRIYEARKDIQGMITVNHNLSLMYHRKGDFKKTIEYLYKEEALKDQLPGSQHSIEAFGAMSGLMVDSLYYREEIIDERAALAKFQRNNDQRAIYRTYRNIGKAHEQLGENILAARNLVRMCLIMEDLGLVPEWNVVAINYRYGGRYDSALYYHHKTRPYFARMTRPYISYTYGLLGDLHLDFGRPDSALHYYQIAIVQDEEMNNRIMVTGIHRNLVNTYRQLKKFEKAEAHLKIGLEQSKEIALIHERNLLDEAKQLYMDWGRYKLAFDYAERFRKMQDSIYRSETVLNLSRLQTEFKTAKRTREVEQLQEQNRLHQAQLDARLLQIALAILLLIIIGGAGAFYFYQYRQKQRAGKLLALKNQQIENQNSVLTRQNREKESLLAEIHHRVKNNLQIISSLINLKARNASVETTQLLLQLGNRIFTMGLIHEKLYRTEDVQSVRLDIYLNELTEHLLNTLTGQETKVRAYLQCEEVEVGVERALACGLICNELVTNSLKYAFAEREDNREIRMTLTQAHGAIEWIVRDNGSMQPVGAESHSNSFGLRFVEQLVKSKLAGTWKVERDLGFKVTIQMPLSV